jgi:ribosomal protein L18
VSVKFTNNGHSTLAASITSSGTSITVASGHGARFPSLSSGEYFYATLIDSSNNLEIVKCTARSSDVLTVTRAQESTTARAYAIGDRIELRVTAAGLNDATNPYDKDTSSTGSFALPVGTDAQEPAAADTEGHIRYNSDDNVVYFSDGTSWLKISSTITTLSSITGTVYSGAASTLTLAGKGFMAANLVVNFTQSSDSIDVDVTVTPTSDTAATVTVPSSVFSNVTAGNTVSITVTNSDGITSPALTKTAVALPTGGTITTYSNYRVHTFTSSGNFVVPSGTSVTADIMRAAGGAGGGGHGGNDGAGGGGAGGMLTDTSVSMSAATYVVGIGGGGGGVGGATVGSAGGNTTFSGLTTCIGGGGGGSETSAQPRVGGSGGSGGGAGGFSGSAGSGTSGQGNAGGAVNGSGSSGGGGGAAGAGNNAGVGGSGRASSLQTGSTIYYSGGGGGSGDQRWQTAGGAGGQGGGGAGAPASSGGTAGNGGANTGGGGGGAAGSNYAGGRNSGSGGSGIVVVRYEL